MMKKKIFLFCLFFGNMVCFGQYYKSISTDSIIQLSKTESVFDVIGEIYATGFNEKEVYYNQELKAFFLQALDMDHLKELEMQIFYKELETNTDWVAIFIEKKCNKLKLNLDSVYKTPLLLDSIIQVVKEEMTHNNREQLKKEKTYPVWGNLMFFVRVPYPEAEQLIKQYWKESHYIYILEALVKMNDPEAIDAYNKLIEEELELGEIGSLQDRKIFLSNNNYTPYAAIKRLEFLTYDFKIKVTGDDPPVPIKCVVLKSLTYDFKRVFKETYPWEQERSCEEAIKKYMPEIKAAAERLAAYYKEQQEYWMKNMPYYKAEKE